MYIRWSVPKKRVVVVMICPSFCETADLWPNVLIILQSSYKDLLGF